MQYAVRLLVALTVTLTSACTTRVSNDDDVSAREAELEAILGCGDPSECAIEMYADEVGTLSAECEEVVRATRIDLVPTAGMVCYGYTPTQVLGCVAEYGHRGADARVLVRNVGTQSEIKRTTIHELMHVAMLCGTGMSDHRHRDQVWQRLTL